ncbi:hypothetical protein GLOTRDRAFT_108722 [Gloeophyllum trabeum ATCC 11539]|uniref:CxC5 like cysteine cluster associated with KDZ domain-containing protein n=1 Tax=Gloeophyllum trabeum (strain ATCC 11539 / FP-39264 / Madison 617) TaxID=670483 RepID=S7PQI2_GLOTA|nr:uncharacterized protein GLOTRDRAFT_108722 [Gloeophyllum trabeum ATCC 11539]EPQ50066.1 hypothetical protein GLOTRDRAFT_108722 [Gloeophyllum trabeum ATCC 11539]
MDDSAARFKRILADSPELSATLSLSDIVRFVDIVRWKKDDIAAIQPSFISGPPEYLPLSYHKFLMDCFSLEHETAKSLWVKYRTLAWEDHESNNSMELEARAKSLIQLFLKHGLQHGIGTLPLSRICMDSACSRELQSTPGVFRSRELVEPLSYKAVFLTRDLGPLPVYCTSLYCRQCNTRYYPNFYVHDQATTRTYYADVPDIIQSAQHVFISRELCELFITLKVVSWTSATNCAKLYNLALGNPSITPLLPSDWPIKFALDAERVWEAFFLYSLLLDHHEHGELLILPHNSSSQFERLRPAIQARNKQMAGPGQPEWNHACNLCCWVSQDEDGNMTAVRSVVTDGVAIGHPCCGVHDCKEPLPSTKGARYCKTHTCKETECAVVACGRPAQPGFDTCDEDDHRALETHKSQEGKAMFQLKRRLERLRTSQVHDSLPTTADSLEHTMIEPIEGTGVGEDTETEVSNTDILCDGKPSTGNRKIVAQFGRRRTHNEELCVCSCGVVIGRATFFGSEAPNGVREFLMTLFPTKRSLPEVLWHDNNCRIRAMLEGDPPDLQSYFEECAMPVDVFHFKSKHKETDIICNTYCNPASWPELHTEDGKWRFNSSAAEQTNAWFGGYQAIVREMDVDRYKLFLDETNRRCTCETAVRIYA